MRSERSVLVVILRAGCLSSRLRMRVSAHGMAGLADVLERRGDDEAKVHYRGTRSRKIRSARFVPVHIESPTGLSVLANRVTRRHLSAGCTSEPWTGVVSTDDVVAFDVQLTSAGRLTATSRKSLAGFKHRVLV